MEEPELYLHPHGCRHFYRLLQEFSEVGLQIIYSTHERSFVNVGDFDSVHIVRKVAKPTGNRTEPKFVRHNNIMKNFEQALHKEIVALFV